MEKVVSSCDEICLFCGEEMKFGFDDRDKYYYCDCADSLLLSKIKHQINELEYSKPKHKFRIIEQKMLVKL